VAIGFRACRYNFLLYVPYQLERIMIFGTLLCLYSFLVSSSNSSSSSSKRMIGAIWFDIRLLAAVAAAVATAAAEHTPAGCRG
jgi:hypothetical protein